MRDKKAYFFIGMGFELVGVVLATIYLGQVVDEKYSLGGMGVALLAMGGLLGWVIHLMVAMKKWGDG